MNRHMDIKFILPQTSEGNGRNPSVSLIHAAHPCVKKHDKMYERSESG